MAPNSSWGIEIISKHSVRPLFPPRETHIFRFDLTYLSLPAGIHLTDQFIPNLTTHYITPQITLSKQNILAACYGIPICLPTWLNNLDTTLQASKAVSPLAPYQWPNEKDYLPEVGPDFEEHYPRARQEWWMPMGDRKNVWRGMTIVMLTDKTVSNF